MCKGVILRTKMRNWETGNMPSIYRNTLHADSLKVQRFYTYSTTGTHNLSIRWHWFLINPASFKLWFFINPSSTHTVHFSLFQLPFKHGILSPFQVPFNMCYPLEWFYEYITFRQFVVTREFMDILFIQLWMDIILMLMYAK